MAPRKRFQAAYRELQSSATRVHDQQDREVGTLARLPPWPATGRGRDRLTGFTQAFDVSPGRMVVCDRRFLFGDALVTGDVSELKARADTLVSSVQLEPAS